MVSVDQEDDYVIEQPRDAGSRRDAGTMRRDAGVHLDAGRAEADAGISVSHKGYTVDCPRSSR